MQYVVTTTPCPLLQLTASTTPEQCGDCRNRGEIEEPTDQPGGGVRGAAVAGAGTKARVADLAAHTSSLLSLLHIIFKRRQCPRFLRCSLVSAAREVERSICPHM